MTLTTTLMNIVHWTANTLGVSTLVAEIVLAIAAYVGLDAILGGNKKKNEDGGGGLLSGHLGRAAASDSADAAGLDIGEAGLLDLIGPEALVVIGVAAVAAYFLL